MLLLLAALLAAGDVAASPEGAAPAVDAPAAVDVPAAAGENDRAGESDAATSEEAAAPPQTTEFSLNAAAGSRGERRAEAVARASGRGLALTLGAADFGGLSAPERQEILLGAQAGALAGELRVVPDSAGLVRAAADLGFHFETVGLILGARTATLGRTQLRGAGVRLELEGELAAGVRGGVSLAAWALQLDAPRARDAWFKWGSSTLDWAQRADASAWLSFDVGEALSLSGGMAAAQSAQPDTWEARAQLAVEVPLGAVKLRAQSALARQWPELWMLDLTAGVSMSLY